MGKVNALYVHIPFCNEICSYCDFVKVYSDEKIIDKYLDCLEKELSEYSIKELKTIYIGGGTPSCLSDKQLERLLSLFESIKLAEEYEFTIEANPESLSENKIQILSRYGVNRVSLGIQTFDERLLKLLNRKHTLDDVKSVVSNLNKYNISNYSFDFIYTLPFQTVEGINKDMDIAISFNPKHLSFYSLLIEEHTRLYIDGYRESEDEKQREMYDFIYKKLSDNGYSRYEISNFSLPGFQSKHNKVYWHDEQYYAIGVSASGYIGDTRYTNTKSLTKYLDGINEKSIEDISVEDSVVEFIMLGLRLDEGISTSEYKRRFKEDFLTQYGAVLDELVNKKMIIIDGDRVKATYDGSLVLHQIIEMFM